MPNSILVEVTALALPLLMSCKQGEHCCCNLPSSNPNPDPNPNRYGYDKAAAVPGNTVSCTEFQFQYYDQTDLDNFNDACGTDLDVDETIGGNKVQQICLLIHPTLNTLHLTPNTLTLIGVDLRELGWLCRGTFGH